MKRVLTFPEQIFVSKPVFRKLLNIDNSLLMCYRIWLWFPWLFGVLWQPKVQCFSILWCSNVCSINSGQWGSARYFLNVFYVRVVWFIYIEICSELGFNVKCWNVWEEVFIITEWRKLPVAAFHTVAIIDLCAKVRLTCTIFEAALWHAFVCYIHCFNKRPRAV